MKIYRLILFYVIIFYFNFLSSFDRSFFYRASSFWDEPRFERELLTTLNIQLAGGSTYGGRNANGKKTSIFGIYGPENLNLDLQKYENFIQKYGINCSHIIDSKFIFTGAFDIFELDLNLYQNMKKGFYWHIHIPAVSLQIFPISCKQCNKNLDNLCSFDQDELILLNNIVKTHHLSLRSINQRGLSDSSIFLGWSINYENTVYLDYIDFALQLGVLFPTGKRKNPHFVFDIPLGYNGFYGITWELDFSIGAYGWLTFGIHNDGVGFFDRAQCINIRSSQESCTGLIRFDIAKAKEKSGPVWRTGAYIKADHVCWGLSIFAGFNFEQKNRNTILKIYNNKNNVKLSTANNNQDLKTWNRWNLNILAEYDFAKYNKLFNPFISILYDYSITGKRIYDTSMIGGYFGVNIAWTF